MKTVNKILLISSLYVAFCTQANADGHKSHEAHTKKFTECAAVRMKEVNLEKLAKKPEKLTTKIPEGWTVISGTGGDGHPKVLICR